MNLTPVTIPKVATKIFPNLVWELPTNEKVLYLTFDDGPTPEITEWTLHQLNKHKAKATFFCIGNNIKKHPEIFNSILKEGHTIGNHTFNHTKGWKTKAKAYIEDVLKTKIEIEKHNISTSLFRPPHGQIKPKQAKLLKALGYDIIMWNVLSIDWDKKISPKQCLENVINHSKPGSIIVFHDSVKATKNMQYTLPKVLEHFSKKGYVFKRIPELNQ
ncbi:polysaccharide deacetylase family protein [Pontimicrobium sp. IMCC45349]|uniref:polysaccharide deacetylase family protein n=1 Tax=Pontimicrobium sp. IMCC45349 TaxID=3391574 RepID=UPI0039A33057